MTVIRAFRTGLCAALCATPLLAGAQIYRCDTDSGVPLYQNSSGPRCVQLDLPGLTTIPAPVLPPGATAPRAAPSRPAGAAAASTPTPAGFPRVEASAQRSRDLDRRRILEDELRKEEARLAELRTEFKGGEPERRGDERNYQKYLDRVERLKDDISRAESSVASLRREMTTLRD
jgi:hypothetical protein